MNSIERSKIKMEIPYFQIPNDIFDLDINLNIYHKIVYVYLCRCCNQGADAFPSYNTIAKKCGMSRRKAIDIVKELIDCNLLFKEVRTKKPKKDNHKDHNDSNLYILNTPSAYCAPPPQCMTCTTPVHTVHHPSACHAPYKELSKNNSLKRTNEEEEIAPVILEFSKAKDKKTTAKEKEILTSLTTKYSKDLVLKAISIAVEQAREVNLKYIKTVLEDWSSKGLITLQQVETHLESENNANKKARNNRRSAVKNKANSKVDSFNDYEQRTYNYDELEKKLLGWDNQRE